MDLKCGEYIAVRRGLEWCGEYSSVASTGSVASIAVRRGLEWCGEYSSVAST